MSYNKNSKIATLIHDNPDTWQDIIESKGIRFHNKGTRYIFNYSPIDCHFDDPVVQEARGIILDIDDDRGSISVVCWPFRKFCNYQEGFADEIDWGSARVQEKVDGSIVKLYHYNGEWVWSTNRMIEAKDAYTETGNMLQLILSSENYDKIPFSELDKDTTYIFELVNRESRVVIKYSTDILYHTGTRNNITGEESEVYLGIIKPKRYPMQTLDECVRAANELNKNGEVVNEGYVVVDKNYHRVKIKSPAYIAVHGVVTGEFTKRQVLGTIIAGVDAYKFIQSRKNKAIYSYYKYKYDELVSDVAATLKYARALYEELDYDRGAVGRALKDAKYGSFVLKGLDNEKTAEELLQGVNYRFFKKSIDDYQHKNVWEES